METNYKNFKMCNNASHSFLQNNEVAVDQISKSFKDLNIQSYIKPKENKGEHLAGVITNIINSLYIVLIKPCSPNNLLYVGTPLFLNNESFQDCERKYMLLGYIEDIFGSIAEPMYSVMVKCDLKNVLNVHTQVYYFPNNPSTTHMSVEYKLDNTTNKEKYKVRIHHT